MPDQLRSDAAILAGLFVEAVFYGMFLITFFQVLLCVLRSEGGKFRRPSGIRIGTLVIALILAINGTLNLAWGMTRAMQTYIFRIQKKNGVNWIDLAKPYTVIIQTLTADLFLTYRCWAVYGKSWKVVVLPVLISLGSLAVFIWILVIQSGMNAHFGDVDHQIKAARALAPLFNAQFSLTVALNVYATTSIVYRIWKTDRITELTSTVTSSRDSSHKRSRLQRIIRIIVESALLYTIASTMAFASSKSNAQYITSAFDIMAVGIAFNLIIIRLARERARERSIAVPKSSLTTLKFDKQEEGRQGQTDTLDSSTNQGTSSARGSSLDITPTRSRDDPEKGDQ